MNNRILELAEQAGAYCEVLRGGDYKPPHLDNMSLEKFAELFAVEISEIVQDLVDSKVPSEEFPLIIRKLFRRQ